jgi:hypothetical protein
MTSSGVTRGSVLKEWTPPYLVVPLREDIIFEDSFLCEQLPRWSQCSVENIIREQKLDAKGGLFRSPQLQRFLRRRCCGGGGGGGGGFHNDEETFKILCLLASLRIANKFCQSGGQDTDKIRFRDKNSQAHEEEDALFMEAWPLVNEFISWNDFRSIHGHVSQHLHVLILPHPLTKYAQKTIFGLNEDDFVRSCQVLQTMALPATSIPQQSIEFPIHRLRASQLLLDHVANMRKAIVGVLLQDPLESGLSQRTFSMTQSCLPNACLELVQSSDQQVSCAWIALYDLPCNNPPDKVSSWTVSTRPKSANCDCTLCDYESRTTTHKNIPTVISNISKMQQLAHYYFQQGEYDRAYTLYHQCHDNSLTEQQQQQAVDEEFCASSTADPASHAKAWHTIADMAHSLAAVLLSQLKFAKAQRHWKKYDAYAKHHSEMQEQLEKQHAYCYFDPLPESTKESLLPDFEPVVPSTVVGDIFMTFNAVDAATCQQLIQSAHDFADNHGGWTTKRHYAVPTRDLPVHKVPDLLKWFKKWMNGSLFSLLQKQFGSTGGGISRFYVHDAFLVQYEATSSSNFLPLHFDESTHSCVVALNDDFDGGGTYFYNLDKTFHPKAGSMVSFRGNKVLHGGSPVTKGVRYILAIFLYLDEDICGDQATTTGIGKRKRREAAVADETKSNGGFSFSFF